MINPYNNPTHSQPEIPPLSRHCKAGFLPFKRSLREKIVCIMLQNPAVLLRNIFMETKEHQKNKPLRVSNLLDRTTLLKFYCVAMQEERWTLNLLEFLDANTNNCLSLRTTDNKMPERNKDIAFAKAELTDSNSSKTADLSLPKYSTIKKDFHETHAPSCTRFVCSFNKDVRQREVKPHFFIGDYKTMVSDDKAALSDLTPATIYYS